MGNVELVGLMHAHIIPAALSLLPGKMSSDRARAMLLAIGLQESGFKHRTQMAGGPARGFWQFEKGGGVVGVLTHPSTAPLVKPILSMLVYPSDAAVVHAALQHHDVLAAIFARLLLWTVPGALPSPTQWDLAWSQYLVGWRPGKPHPKTWRQHYLDAWQTVLEQ